MHRSALAPALLAFALLLTPSASASAQTADGRVQLTLQPDQARATLRILALRAGGEPVPDSLWTALHETEGYRRVMERERGMDERFGVDRGIDDASFRAWALSDGPLESWEAQRAALAAWEAVDLDAAARRALAYLPAGARLEGTIYPLVREQTNSFVWDLGTDDPAIFMYLEPGKTAPELEHTLAHELHHIGSTGACDEPGSAGTAGAEAAEAMRWISGFGEGIAVLAAAGGPDGDTHPYDPPTLRAAWAGRLDSLRSDMAELESFFTAILDGDLPADSAGPTGMSFLSRPGSPQGAFYTVGWHMATAVERAMGRPAVVAAVCDPVRLLLDYQAAATAGGLPTWSSGFIDRLRALRPAE